MLKSRKISVERRKNACMGMFSAAAAAGLALTAGAGEARAAGSYSWSAANADTTPASANFSVGFTPTLTGPADSSTQLAFVAGTYTATNDLGALTLNSMTFGASGSAAAMTVTVNNTSGGALTFAGTTPSIVVNGGSATISAPIVTADGMQITNSGAGTLQLGSETFATGTTTITNSGAGNVTLSDAVTYAGTNAVVNLVNSGTGMFKIGNFGSVLSGTINVSGAVAFAGNTAGDLFGNSLILNVNSAGSFDFAGNGETMGGITGSGNVMLTSASVTLVAAGDRAFYGVFSGTGGLLQNSAYVLSLGGLNTYSGTTTVEGNGTIRATMANVFSPNSLVNIIAGSNLDPGGFSQTIAGLIGLSSATVVPVTAGTLTIAPATGVTDTFAGSFTGGGNLTIAGPGVEVLNGTGGVSGTVNVSGGTLRTSYPALSTASGLIIGSSGLLDLTNNTVSTFSSSQSLGGALVLEGTGSLTIAANSPTSNLTALTITSGGLNLAASSTGVSQIGSPSLNTSTAVLTVNGTPGSTTFLQSFSGITLNGSLELNATAGSGGTATVAVGGITRLNGSGGTIDFNATNTGATFTSTAVNNTSTGIIGSYATYNGSSWAVGGTSGTATTVTPFASYNPNSFAAGNHTDVTTNFTVATSGSSTYDVRFNTAGAETLTLKGVNSISDGGILVTPIVGSNLSTITGGTSLTAGANQDLVVQQFNVNGGLTIASVLSGTLGTSITVTGVTTTTSTTITGLSSTTGLSVGEFVSGATLSSGARIVSINSPTSITVTLAPTAGTGQTLTFVPITELVKAGPGTLTLSGTSTAFNGSIGVNSGVTQVVAAANLGGSSSNSSSSAIIFNGGTLATTASFSLTTLNTQPFIFGAAGGTINVAPGTTLTRNADSFFGTGPLTLTSSGTGMLALGSNGSTFAGTVTVNGGILSFTSSKFASANGVTINNNGQYQINDNGAGTFGFASGTQLSLSGTGPAGYADPGAFALTVQTGTGGPTSTFTNNIVLTGNAEIGVYSTSANSTTPSAYASALILSGSISGPGALISAGVLSSAGSGGSLTLTGTNTYAGGTIITSGVLSVASDLQLGTAPASPAINLTLDGGRLEITSTSTLNPNRTIQLGATLPATGVEGTSISTKSSSTTVTYNGSFMDKAGSIGVLAKQGAGTLSLGGTSAYSGNTYANNGTLQLAVNNALPSGTTVYVGQNDTNGTNVGTFDLNGYTQTIAGLNSIAGSSSSSAVNIVTSSAASAMPALTLSGSQNYNYGTSTSTNLGLITNTIAINKTGSGTQLLGGANNYSGGTTITGGVLVANAQRTLSAGVLVSSSTGTGPVNISSGGTLAGSGGTGDVTVTGTITAGTGVTPTDTIGTLSTGMQTWNGNGTYVVKLDGSSAGTLVAGSSDQLILSGLTASSTGLNVTPVAIATGLTSFQPGSSYTFLIASSTTANAFTNLLNAIVVTPNSSSPAGTYSVSDDANGDQLILNYTDATPEPTSMILLGVAITPLVLGRRRRANCSTV